MRRHMSPLNYSVFARGVNDLYPDVACWACQTDPANRWKCLERSAGLVDVHHIVPQRVIRREVEPAFVIQALRDPRNGVPLRRWHHTMVEAAMTRIALPDEAWAFAADFELVWYLERIERAAAA